MQGKRKGGKSAAKANKAKSKAASAKKSSASESKTAGQERLRPGQLEGLVLGYMKKREADLPITATKVASGIKRSSGAVGNCLERLAKTKKVRRVGKKPRRYDLTDSTK